MEGGWANYTGLSYSGVGYHNQNNRGSEHGNRRALTAEENYPNRGSRYDPSNDENELHHCDSSNEDEDQLHRRGTQRPASPHPLGPLDFSNSPDGGSPAGNDRHHQKKVGGKTTGNAKTDCVKTGRRRKDARDREDERHVWSDYEMQTVLALICKGVHLQPGGTLTFATQLNEALNGNKGNCLDNDIDLQDVETLLNWVYQKKRGALKFIERQKPQRLTRLATRVFSRNLPFDGSKKEWLVEGRRDQEAAERSEKFRRLRREEDGATIPRKGRVLENYPSNGAAQFRRMYEGVTQTDQVSATARNLNPIFPPHGYAGGFTSSVLAADGTHNAALQDRVPPDWSSRGNGHGGRGRDFSHYPPAISSHDYHRTQLPRGYCYGPPFHRTHAPMGETRQPHLPITSEFGSPAPYHAHNPVGAAAYGLGAAGAHGSPVYPAADPQGFVAAPHGNEAARERREPEWNHEHGHATPTSSWHHGHPDRHGDPRGYHKSPK